MLIFNEKLAKLVAISGILLFSVIWISRLMFGGNQVVLTSELSESIALKKMLGYNSQQPLVPKLIAEEKVLHDLGYSKAGIVGDHQFNTFSPGDSAYIGWVIKRNPDNSFQTGVGTLARDPISGKCKVLTVQHLVSLPSLVSSPRKTQESEDAEYRFVRAKPNGYGRPVEIFPNEVHIANVDIPIFMDTAIQFDDCIAVHDLSYADLTKKDFKSVTRMFSGMELTAVSPVRDKSYPYYALQSTNKYTLRSLYVGILRSDLDSFKGMSGSPVLIRSHESEEYKILGLFSSGPKDDCGEFKPLSCRSVAVMMSKRQYKSQ